MAEFLSEERSLVEWSRVILGSVLEPVALAARGVLSLAAIAVIRSIHANVFWKADTVSEVDE
jgi:hypothetical protein